MKIWRIACAVFGLVLILAGVAVSQFSLFLPTVRFAEVKPVDGTTEIVSTYIDTAPTADLSRRRRFDLVRVEITYSGHIREDETLKIQAQINQQFLRIDSDRDPGVVSTDPVRRSPINSLKWPITITLSGAAFHIDPKVQSFETGTGLPVKALWTVLPKRTGIHTLLFDWSGIMPKDQSLGKPQFSNSAVFVNQVEVPSRNDFLVKLPVEVFTKWGIRPVVGRHHLVCPKPDWLHHHGPADLQPSTGLGPQSEV